MKLSFFGRKKKKEESVTNPEEEVTYESFSALYFPNGKLADGYPPHYIEKLEAIREELRIKRDEKLRLEAEKPKEEKQNGKEIDK